MERCQDPGCNKALRSVAIVGGERFYLQCDTCLEYFCQEHCEVDDDNGNCECDCCLETRMRREKGEEVSNECYARLNKVSEGA